MYFCCASFFSSGRVILYAYRLTPLEAMCERHHLIRKVVEDTDVRLFDRYRRPLGLDHKLAERMEIC